MKNLFTAAIMVVFCFALFYLSVCLTSCTATLRADKLWYNGNIARPAEYVVLPDTLR